MVEPGALMYRYRPVLVRRKGGQSHAVKGVWMQRDLAAQLAEEAARRYGPGFAPCVVRDTDRDSQIREQYRGKNVAPLPPGFEYLREEDDPYQYLLPWEIAQIATWRPRGWVDA